jgi:hypothetical protein
VAGPVQGTLGDGSGDAFVAKIGTPAAPPITVGTLQGAFYQNPNNSGSFDLTPGNSSGLLAFTQSFSSVDFNPPASASILCSNGTGGVNETTRPFTDIVPNPDGTCAQVVAQGNGYQAGSTPGCSPSPGTLCAFEAVFTGSLSVFGPGQVTFNF